MGQLALSFPPSEPPKLAVIVGGRQAKDSTYGDTETATGTSRALAFWAWSLVILQILDGVMTAIGVGHYGHEAEANFLLKLGMELIGPVPTLIIAKSLAIFVVYLLVQCAQHVRWVPRAIQAVTALYLFAAILPWSYILLRHYLA